MPPRQTALCIRALVALSIVSSSCAVPENRNVVLIPLDDRPATANYAKRIGEIGGWFVQLPPRKSIGQYTTPGNPAEIDAWLRSPDLPTPRVALVSVDMLTYGGMLGSRSSKVSLDEAKNRLEILRELHKRYPRVDIHAFSSILRLEPNPIPDTASWRVKLTRWGELKAADPAQMDPVLATELAQLEREIDPHIISNIMAIRSRNLQINLAALELLKQGVVDHLVLSQEDGRSQGLHRDDESILRRRIDELGVGKRARIEQSADETGSLLLSRAAIEVSKKTVRLQVVYSSDRARKVTFPSEGSTLESRVEQQARASGATLAHPSEASDYILYVNAPQTGDEELKSFLSQMISDLKSGKVVALADVLNAPPGGAGADERIVETLNREGLFDRFAAYASYGSPGNELGTVIAAANMRILAMASSMPVEDLAKCEAARLAFVFQRFIADYVYLDKVRPELDRTITGGSEQLGYEAYQRVHFVQQVELTKRANDFFATHFKGRTYQLPGNQNKSITINRLKDVSIYVPWYRAFETGVELNFEYSMN